MNPRTQQSLHIASLMYISEVDHQFFNVFQMLTTMHQQFLQKVQPYHALFCHPANNSKYQIFSISSSNRSCSNSSSTKTSNTSYNNFNNSISMNCRYENNSSMQNLCFYNVLLFSLSPLEPFKFYDSFSKLIINFESGHS